tara:strand:+ start:315 stop:1478 length:1164 start_codon:yes stop_codon:yes gene_type:complete
MDYDFSSIPDRPEEPGFFDFLKLDNRDDVATLAQFLGTGAVLGQNLGLFGSDRQPDIGYQGTVPKYTAVRDRVANTFDPNRRPGSGGQRYFSDIRYVPEEGDVAAARTASIADAEGLAALNLTNPAKQVRVPRTLPPPIISPNTPTELPTVPTAESVMPVTPSPFTSPYQYIEDNPFNPLNIATPYNQGRKVNKGLSTIEKALMNYDPGKYDRGLGGLLGLTKPGPEIKERPSFTEIDLGMNDPDKRIRTAFQKRRFGELPMTPKEEAEFLRMFGTDYIDRAGPKGSRRREYATGGIAELGTRKQRYLDGETDGMADEVPATIDNEDPAALSDGEYVIPADVVSHLGNGNSDAGAKVLDEMLSRVREARTGETEQAPEINPKEFLPA